MDHAGSPVKRVVVDGVGSRPAGAKWSWVTGRAGCGDGSGDGRRAGMGMSKGVGVGVGIGRRRKRVGGRGSTYRVPHFDEVINIDHSALQVVADQVGLLRLLLRLLGGSDGHGLGDGRGQLLLLDLLGARHCCCGGFGGLAVDVAAGCSGWAAKRWFGGEWRVLARWSGGPGAGCNWCGGGVCCVSDALVIIASVRGGWECPGKPGGLEDERERRGKRERQAKVGGGRFIGNLGGPELLADLERVQLFGRRNPYSCAGCGLQVRAQAQAHRTTWHLAPTLAPALYTGHFPVRATGDGQPADQPWKSPSCPPGTRAHRISPPRAASSKLVPRPPSPIPSGCPRLGID